MRSEIILKILGFMLAGVIIWYNTNIYNAFKIGQLTEEWYLIFLIFPLFILIGNYLIAKKLSGKD